MQSEYPVTIGSKVYQVRYNFRSLKTIASLSGVPLPAFLEKCQNLDVDALMVLLYAGIQKHHSEIKLDNVLDILDDCDEMTPVLEGFLSALSMFLRGKDAVKKKEPEQTN
jgi:hypothetical protein